MATSHGAGITVFIALYARDGSEFGFYEVGGAVPCPRSGRPAFMTFAEFLNRLKSCYYARNLRDFRYEGEEPNLAETDDESDDAPAE